MKLIHKFVKNIPDKTDDGILYISVDYCTTIHRCCCGCGNEVVAPLSPTDWELIFNGETVSLFPSIGNWNFECKSHYWITNNNIEWSYKWNKEQIDNGVKKDQLNKQLYYQKGKNKSFLKLFFNKKNK